MVRDEFVGLLLLDQVRMAAVGWSLLPSACVVLRQVACGESAVAPNLSVTVTMP